jgi:ABC-type Zn uptake system ZnuABC Zn-binding protein ZnuA
MARAAVAICVLGAALAGCGSDRATRGEGTLEVVATTAPLADIVRNAGGRRVHVTVLVPRDADPHRWRPGPGDLTAPGDADLVVRSGGEIDAWAAGADEAERTLTLLPRVEPLGDDPHWWLDPVRVQRAVKEIRNELARADVHGAGYYEAASADFLVRLRRLDRGIRRCLSPLLGRSRERLAAQHDAFAYFSARYGIEFVRPRRATVGRRLWSDTLGPSGTPAGSYLGAMSANTAAIVDGLTGGEGGCRPHP